MNAISRNFLSMSAYLLLSGGIAHAQFTTLDDTATIYGTYARGIEGDTIFGRYRTTNPNGPYNSGFLYDGTAYTTFDYPGATSETYISGISGNIIVGSYYYLINVNGNITESDAIKFVYNTATNAHNDIPNLGVVDLGFNQIDGNYAVGTYADGIRPGRRGYVYDVAANTYTNTDISVPNALNTYAIDISGNNIVGYYQDASNTYHSFLYDGVTYTTLDDPLSLSSTIAVGIDGNNIVGYYFNNTGTHGFLYNGSTYTALDDPFADHQTYATGISGNKVVGYFEDLDGNDHSFVYTAVPEPGSIALLATSALPVTGAGFLVRRRRQARQAA